MSSLRQVLLGVLAALLSGVLVIGSFALAMVESGITIAQGSTSAPTSAGTPSPLPLIRTSAPGEPTFTASPTSLPTTTPASAGAPAPLPTLTLSCPQPEGWIPITVQAGDTLAGLAQVYGIPVGTLMENNCLVVESLATGSLLFVPGVMPTPPASATPSAGPATTEAPPTDSGPSCGPFPGWVRYTVRPGDTLSNLSRSTGASVSQLQLANCMGSSTVLRAGTSIYVPRLPALPPASPTLRATATAMPTNTPVPPSATNPPPTITSPSRTPLPPTATRIPTDPPPPPTPAEEPPTQTPAPPTPTPAPPTLVPTTVSPPTTEAPTLAPPPTIETVAPQAPSDTQSPEAPSETQAPEPPSETQAPASVSP